MYEQTREIHKNDMKISLIEKAWNNEEKSYARGSRYMKTTAAAQRKEKL